MFFILYLHTRLGSSDQIKTFTTETGSRVAEVSGELREIVVATAADISKLGLDTLDLQEGVYLVGTGSSGAAETFVTLGCTYFSTMLLASFLYRVPKDGWKPDGWQPPSQIEDKNITKTDAIDGSDKEDNTTNRNTLITTANVDINQSLKTPQFYLLWTNLFCNVSAGIGVLGVAKTMMGDIFSTSMPSIVDTAFAAKVH